MGKMKIAVLGLGESLGQIYTDAMHGRFDITIGVNDIWSKYKTDYVVCVDRADRFTPERLETINNCRPVRFYSQVDDWAKRPDFFRITLQHDYPNYLCQLDIPELPKSLCSPFVACAVAYKYHDPCEIHLFGVDLITHPHLKKDSMLSRIIRHFTNLRDELSGRGIAFIVHGDGALRSMNKLLHR